MAKLKKAKMVEPVPMTPIWSAEKWPSVAIVSGTEPAKPPCHTTKPE